MQQLVLLLFIGGMALPALSARRVTVEQLERVLTAAHGKSDAEIARQLSELELTERLNETRLTRLEAELPGSEARQALLVLGDGSAFLDLPAAEIPATPAPKGSGPECPQSAASS